MMWECDMFLRYNLATEQWRMCTSRQDKDKEEQAPPVNQKVNTNLAQAKERAKQCRVDWTWVVTYP
eukprot:8236039-Ditylum_brightwellii.AAC.1